MDLTDDGAARRALISSGIVGLTTALLTKQFGVKIEVSLPLGVATAISLDYAVNKRRVERELKERNEHISVSRNLAGDFINQELGISAWGTEYDSSLWRAQILTGTIGLLAGAYMRLGEYITFRKTGHEVAVQTGAAGQVVGAAGVAWGLYRAADLARDMGGFTGWFYDLLRPRVRTMLQSMKDLYQMNDLTDSQIEAEINDILPDVDPSVQDMFNERAQHIMAERADGPRLIVPPGESFESIASDLPGVPDITVEPGRITLLRSRDGSGEVAMVWESSASSETLARIVPVVTVDAETLEILGRTLVDEIARDAARSALEDEQRDLYGAGRSSGSLATSSELKTIGSSEADRLEKEVGDSP